jgi:hypothetical protein
LLLELLNGAVLGVQIPERVKHLCTADSVGPAGLRYQLVHIGLVELIYLALISRPHAIAKLDDVFRQKLVNSSSANLRNSQASQAVNEEQNMKEEKQGEGI